MFPGEQSADHISEGRFGLNIVVAGTKTNLMFGLQQRGQDRYAYAQEWIDAIKRMWSDVPEFNFSESSST